MSQEGDEDQENKLKRHDVICSVSDFFTPGHIIHSSPAMSKNGSSKNDSSINDSASTSSPYAKNPYLPYIYLQHFSSRRQPNPSLLATPYFDPPTLDKELQTLDCAYTLLQLATAPSCSSSSSSFPPPAAPVSSSSSAPARRRSGKLRGA